MLHITKVMRRTKKAFSCFAPERRHKIAKGICAFSYNKLDEGILRTDLSFLLQKIKDGNIFLETFLVPPLSQVDGMEDMFKDFGVLDCAHQSNKLTVRSGTYWKKDCIAWRADDGQVCAGEAQAFLRLCFKNSGIVHLLLVNEYQHVQACLWSTPTDVKPAMIPHHALLTALAYRRLDGGLIRVLWPLAPR